jgi:exopolyphosphatase/pppGpp-phosphohydrolase
LNQQERFNVCVKVYNIENNKSINNNTMDQFDQQNLINTVRSFLLNENAEMEKLSRLATFANTLHNHISTLPKYKKALETFKGLRSNDIKGPQHEEGIVSAMIQIAQDPDANKSQSSGDNVKEQIEGFLKRFYPARVKEIGADMSKAKGKLGPAGVQY